MTHKESCIIEIIDEIDYNEKVDKRYQDDNFLESSDLRLLKNMHVDFIIIK